MEKLQSLGSKFRHIPTEKYDGSTFHYPNIQEIGHLIATAKTDEELDEALADFEYSANQDVSEVVAAIMERISRTP